MSLELIWRHCVSAIAIILLGTVLFGALFPYAVCIVSSPSAEMHADSSYIVSMKDLAKLQKYATSRRYFYPRLSTTIEHPYNTRASGSVLFPLLGSRGRTSLANRLREGGIGHELYEEMVLRFPDAITVSASGLDPHITCHNALSQAPFVAEARGIDLKEVTSLIQTMRENTFSYEWALFPQVVNVIQLNEALGSVQE